jgi:CRP-like cAMP-binding protein
MRADVAEPRTAERAGGLLAELAVHERNAIHRASEVQFCAAGDMLLRANARSRFVFFPISAVVSVLRPLRDDRAVEIGLLGNEGMLGIDVVLETRNQLDEAMVQSAGFVYCMPTEDLRHQFDATGRLQKSILRFSQAFLGQASQNALCLRYHAVTQRLARWLLMVDDRAGSIEPGKSARLLARALGAEESEVAESLAELVSAGAVQQRRSAILIERDALEIGACECYDAVRMHGRAEAR